MATTNWTMKIAGNLVNVVQGSLDVINQIGQRSTGSVSVWSPLGTFYQYGTQVQVFDQNGVQQYSGFVSKDKVTKGTRQGQGYLEHQIQLMDNCYKADKRLVFAQYLNLPAGTIVKNILSQVLSAEGVTSTLTSIAAGTTMTAVIWNGKQASAALTWLATQSGYWWNIDSNNVLWFQPYTGVSAPFTLDGTQVSVDSNLMVTYGNDLLVNRQYVKGAYAEVPVRTETFHGNSLNRSFTLSYPVSRVVSITLNGVVQTISTKGSTGNQWYFFAGDAVIAQDGGGTPIASGDTLAVTYAGRYPILALAQSGTLISAQKAREGGGTGFIENEFHNAKIYTQQVAFQTAGALLAHYGVDMTQLEFNTLTPGLMEGQILTVNLPDFGLTTQMLITTVEITDGINEQFNIWYHVAAVGSPWDAAQWQTYWQNLQNQSVDPSDFSSVDDAAGLALLLLSTIVLSATIVVHATTTTCPICNTSTICNAASPIIC